MAVNGSTNQALLDAQLELWHTAFGYIKSMALKSALDLHIPEAIHQHGGAATLAQIASTATLHSFKVPSLRRLMRVLAATGVLTAGLRPSSSCGGDEPVYALTPMSRLLVGKRSLSPIIAGVSSLIDVAGGLGAAAQSISKAFPQVNCSVLDLDHVVAMAPPDTDVQYIAGDMFESVPPANAMLSGFCMTGT
ncbi:hypothetical protein EJB05_08906, partial [Eragrostis curvula]